MDLLYVTANLGAGATRKTLKGRSYLVADATIMPPGGGVMNGSQGALFYPPEEQRRDVGAWNDIPLTLHHPFDPISGKHLSANAPGVLDRQGLGFIRRDRLEGDKRRVKAWFDEAETKGKAPEVYNRLVKGESIELSTGLYTDNIPARPGSNFQGKPYDFVAVNYRPDHLAILPDQQGACSRRDGCGVFNATGLRNAGTDMDEGCRCEGCQKKRAGVLTDNPAVSEAQRRYLNSQFGHDWVKAHDFDNKGPLPETANCNAEIIGNTFDSDEQREAFFGHLKSAGGASASGSKEPGFEAKPARYAKGQVAIHAKSDDSGFKTRAMRLAEGVGGRWSNREKAYIMSQSKADKLKDLHDKGHDYSPITKEFRQPRANNEDTIVNRLQAILANTEKEGCKDDKG